MKLMQLPHYNAGVYLTHNEKRYCEHWLLRWSKLERHVTTFSRKSLEHFIIYEVHTRQRDKVVSRLLARLYKLRRQAATEDLLLRVMPNTCPQPVVSLATDWSDNERERNRNVLMQTSKGVRREGDKTDIV